MKVLKHLKNYCTTAEALVIMGFVILVLETV